MSTMKPTKIESTLNTESARITALVASILETVREHPHELYTNDEIAAGIRAVVLRFLRKYGYKETW